MTKIYNTPKRNHIVKTRLNDEEYEHFQRRLEVYGMNQSALIRKALSDATIRPVIVVSPVNDDLLAALGKLTSEYSKIGNNLNQLTKLSNMGQIKTVDLYETRAAMDALYGEIFRIARTKDGDN